MMQPFASFRRWHAFYLGPDTGWQCRLTSGGMRSTAGSSWLPDPRMRLSVVWIVSAVCLVSYKHSCYICNPQNRFSASLAAKYILLTSFHCVELSFGSQKLWEQASELAEVSNFLTGVRCLPHGGHTRLRQFTVFPRVTGLLQKHISHKDNYRCFTI